MDDPYDITQDELDDARRFLAASREAKNMLAIGGDIDRACNAVLGTNEPDAVRAYLVALAHAAVDMGISVYSARQLEKQG